MICLVNRLAVTNDDAFQSWIWAKFNSSSSCVPVKKFFFKHVYSFSRDREWAGEGKRERETENLKQAPGSELSAHNPTQGLNPSTVRSWSEVGCLTNWATQEPLCVSFNCTSALCHNLQAKRWSNCAGFIMSLWKKCWWREIPGWGRRTFHHMQCALGLLLLSCVNLDKEAFQFLKLIIKRIYIYIYILNFIFYFRERQNMWMGEEAEGERENLEQAPCSAQSPTWGPIPPAWDHDPSWNQESDAQLAEPPRCP